MKKIKIKNKARTRKIKENQVTNLVTRLTRAIIQKPIHDSENPRTEKFATSLLSQGFKLAVECYGIRTGIDKWRVLKSDPTIPSFMDLSDETRSRIVYMIRLFASSPSLVVAMFFGRNSRSIAQIRRWHIPNWRELNNQDIKNACGDYRVI